MADAKYKPGDVVQLVSGGPNMTVEEVHKKISGDFNGTYRCTWFSGQKHNAHNFAEEAVKLAPSKS